MANKLQKNFKKQMQKTEKQLSKDAKKGKGVLTNKHYMLRFYGHFDNKSNPENPAKKVFRFIFKIIKFIITIFILFCVIIVIISIAATLKAH